MADNAKTTSFGTDEEAGAPPAGGGAGTNVDCPVVRPGEGTAGKEGLAIFAGISAESVGAHGLSLQLESVPPGARGRAHLHADHESAIYVLSGAYECRFGPELQHRVTVRAGEFQYVPAGVPHLPINLSDDEPVVALVARTDPNAQERVVLLPALDPAV